MATTLTSAVDDYLRAKSLARGTRNEYFSTLRKWERWGGGVTIEALRRKDVCAFLDWVYERAVAEAGTNPGRTANKAREHLRAVLSWAWEQDLIDSPPRFPKPREQRDERQQDADRVQHDGVDHRLSPQLADGAPELATLDGVEVDEVIGRHVFRDKRGVFFETRIILPAGVGRILAVNGGNHAL